MLDYAVDWIESINPTLLSSPPPCQEITGKDVCFLGPSGDIQNNDTVLCSHLIEGHRCVVATWYLNPERHLYEFVLGTFIFVSVVRNILPYLQHPFSFNPVHNPKSKGKQVIRPSVPLQITTLFIYILMVTYKSFGYPGKQLMVFMPCNVNWTILLSLSYMPYPYLNANASHILCQMLIPMMGLTLVALVEADLGDVVLPFEVVYYFLHHTLLLLFPLYFLISGKITSLPILSKTQTIPKFSYIMSFLSTLGSWWMMNCALFGLLYVSIVTPLSIVSGINLNYMMSPPPGAPEAGVSGENYRILSAGVCAFVFFIVRVLVMLIEAFIRYFWDIPFIINDYIEDKTDNSAAKKLF